MDARIVQLVIDSFQALSAELISVITLFFCCVSMAAALRVFGSLGLYLFNVVAVIVANIHVLKISQFSIFPKPLALGTVIFATTYLASDILTELYGLRAAQRGVGLAFGGQILMTGLMLLGLGHPPVPGDPMHAAMMLLFTPSVRLLVASLAAFTFSQFFDIWVFQRIKDVTGVRWLWLRTTLSFLSAAFLDNVIFSLLAWKVLASEPLSFHDVWHRYILGTFSARVLVAMLSMPMMYGVRYFHQPFGGQTKHVG